LFKLYQSESDEDQKKLDMKIKNIKSTFSNEAGIILF
jgi:hypothetical protein